MGGANNWFAVRKKGFSMLWSRLDIHIMYCFIDTVAKLTAKFIF